MICTRLRWATTCLRSTGWRPRSSATSRRSYPDHPLAGNSFYYQGEIDYRAARYATAIKNYDRVIEQFPDNNKVPAAHLHKAQSLIQLKQNEAGIRELRALIQRFPNSPEAVQARSRLSGMGVPVKARTS